MDISEFTAKILFDVVDKDLLINVVEDALLTACYYSVRPHREVPSYDRRIQFTSSSANEIMRSTFLEIIQSVIPNFNDKYRLGAILMSECREDIVIPSSTWAPRITIFWPLDNCLYEDILVTNKDVIITIGKENVRFKSVSKIGNRVFDAHAFEK